MKAFDKWWSHISYFYKPYEIHYHKRGWKAALKWVLKHDPDIGIASCIRKELEE